MITMEASNEKIMGTMVPDALTKSFSQPNVVKAVVSKSNRALLSRSPIPHYREEDDFDGFWQHIGVYAFKKVR